MIRVNNIPLPLEGDMEQLRKKAAKALGLRPGQLDRVKLLRQSIDARKKDDVHYVYTLGVSLANESQVLKTAPGKNLTWVEEREYLLPKARRTSSLPPVVVGMGPAGLFAALTLARMGLKPIVLERGREVAERTRDVEHFWRTGALSRTSNVQFGEGGAGTFSDGKLTTGTSDPRQSFVFQTLVDHGAPEDITYSHKPHIGTDVLRDVVASIRREIISLGGEVRFEHQLHALHHDGGQLTAITVMTEEGPYDLPCDALILAPGHSARDTFAMLYQAGVPMEGKQFAVGVRIEHLQQRVSLAQYGPAWEQLPPSDYKLSCHLPSGRSAFTFCVCPGGHVVAAASDYGQVVTNGMSYRAREGKNINGGFLVGVGPQDFPGSDPLAGVRFQEQWERAAWDMGTGGLPPLYQEGSSVFRAPAQLVGDLLKGNPSTGHGEVVPTYKPGVTWGSLEGALPGYVLDTLKGALPLMDRKLHGFAHPEGVLTGVETRSSSPLRILRDEHGQSQLRGLYPCGEGAGYAGGIVSAAVDGVRIAEFVAEN